MSTLLQSVSCQVSVSDLSRDQHMHVVCSRSCQDDCQIVASGTGREEFESSPELSLVCRSERLLCVVQTVISVRVLTQLPTSSSPDSWK